MLIVEKRQNLGLWCSKSGGGGGGTSFVAPSEPTEAYGQVVRTKFVVLCSINIYLLSLLCFRRSLSCFNSNGRKLEMQKGCGIQ